MTKKEIEIINIALDIEGKVRKNRAEMLISKLREKNKEEGNNEDSKHTN